MEKIIVQEILKDIDDVLATQLADPATRTEEYLRGMANGMILAKSIINKQDPDFVEPQSYTDKA